MTEPRLAAVESDHDDEAVLHQHVATRDPALRDVLVSGLEPVHNLAVVCLVAVLHGTSSG
jgi:hypothetical protein